MLPKSPASSITRISSTPASRRRAAVEAEFDGGEVVELRGVPDDLRGPAATPVAGAGTLLGRPAQTKAEAMPADLSRTETITQLGATIGSFDHLISMVPMHAAGPLVRARATPVRG
ncbi:hypothetical protein MUY14_16860 [Amycolatopsis sp. FBCC-B4732]|uniref:hypothetical protein n=1 Tax=Amycolatopsis sp. FBCC-B4732 TaxID=3079339 RepID=UPI001FF0FBE0|nr:hypothetical protein [Amycolatopsis sp. FBCC-B4732]UOX92207.1 hypothetical protein MUY14_16860 [Amycolatopsis sp. FBCC-B4732]